MVQLILLGIGLAMDAFAVAISKGLNMRKINYKHALIIALSFGGFQAIMPLIGWLLGIQFASYIESVDHWVAFILLAFIGGKMIYEAVFDSDSEEVNNELLDLKELLLLSVATSIDALAVGITLALMPDTNIYLSILVIGIVTFILSFCGVIIGNKFGSKYEKKAQIFGGVILILIGLKILLEHLEVLAF